MTPRAERRHPRSKVEWVVFAASIAVIAAIVGVLAWSAVGSSDDEARFVTTIQTIRQEAGAFHVPVSVENVGERTAASVSVYAEVGRGAEATRVERTVDYLFAGEQHLVTFVFPDDPLDRSLRVGVDAYEEP